VSGAVDLSKCRKSFDRRIKYCDCGPKCSVCGFGPHMAVHGPVLGMPPGSAPYDHEYRPTTPTP